MGARPLGAEGALAIVPSMLDVDFAYLAAEAAELEAAGADRLQWDVMDGRFVPKLTHGADLLARTRGCTRLPFEAHLMVARPENLWQSLAEAGADLLIVHAETTGHLHLLLSDIRQSGCAAGVAVNPATPLVTVAHVLDLVDLLLIMTVNPGRGGQAFIHTTLDKVTEARQLLDRAGSAADLEVDGGVTAALAPELVRRGANVLVAGSAVHRHPGGRAAAISELRQAARQGLIRTDPGSVIPATAGRQ
jgi:ribulose-phosphate 3-epimerase